jgi:recombination protein RecT
MSTNQVKNTNQIQEVKDKSIVTKKREELQKLFSHSKVKSRLINLLGDEEKYKAFISTVENLTLLNKELFKCTTESIVKAALQAVEVGLPISKSLGTMWFVPYRNNDKGVYEAQVQIGYKGWKVLALDDGIMSKPIPVFDVDEFSIEFDGIDEKIRLIPNLKERKMGDDEWVKKHLIGVIVNLKYTRLGGEVENHFIPRDVLDKLIRHSKSASKSASPYNSGWWLEMVVYARALSYILRKAGVTGKRIANAFAVENGELNVELPKQEKIKKELDDEVEEIEVEEVEI